MSSFAPPKSRQLRRLLAVVGASLLVAMIANVASAQGAITPLAELAPRAEREKLAPAVMQADALQAVATANQLAWDESVKRLSEVEQNDPADALAQYKRFFGERAMSPALGVQVGLKIAQMRLAMNDADGALQTCEVIGAKYADEPTVVLLTLQKARVLMKQQQLATASEEVNAAMPSLVALGPSRYREISDLLLKLVQANLDEGEDPGKERAQALCVGVEEIYLQWLKGNTVDHLWERFEALQVNYQQAGGRERAGELLPKVGDALLQLPVESNNGELSVMSYQMARWLSGKHNGKSDASSLLYTKAAYGSDDAHAAASILEGVGQALKSDPERAQQQLLQLQKEVTTPSAQFATQFLMAWARYNAGDWGAFLTQSEEVLKQYEAINDRSRRQAFAPLALQLEDGRKWARLWQTKTLVAENPDLDLRFDGSLEQPIERRIFVDTPTPTALQIAVTGDIHRITTRLEDSPWAPDLAEVRHQQIVVVSISPGVAQATATIRVTASTSNAEPLELPIRVSKVQKGESDS